MSRRERWARVHERAWSVAAAAAVAVGLFGSFRAWGPLPTLATFLAAATLGGVCHLSVASILTPELVPWRRLGLGALLAGALTLAVGGLVEVSGAGAVWVVTVLIVTWAGWPALVRRLRPSKHSTQPTSDDAEPASPEPVEAAQGAALVIPDRLEDADLCLAWRSSFVALQRATSPESRLRVVCVRALYLDEMERTNPAAFGAWLSSGPRAATSPRDLRTADDDHPAAT